jgi:hypothetical protein
MEVEQQLDVMQHLIEVSSTLAEAPEGTWIILYKGKQIELESKKRHWKKINHAKTALSSQIKYTFHQFLRRVQNVDYEDTSDIYAECIAELEAAGILEFRNVV